MGKRYSSVLEMVEAASDVEYAKRFEQTLKDNSISTYLFVLRNKLGLTEKELAVLMECSTEDVERMEQTSNRMLTEGDLVGYLVGLGKERDRREESLQKALDYAVSIIENYEMDIRRSINMGNIRVGFCQGSVYKNAVNKIQELREEKHKETK